MTAKLKFGWKIITSDERRSIVAPSSGRASRVYLKGRRVRPAVGAGPLAVFDNRNDASKFLTYYIKRNASSEDQFRTVKCRYTQSKERCIWFEGLERRQNSPSRPWRGRVPLTELPSGTILADFITCLS